MDQLAEQLQSVSKNNARDLVYLQTSKGIYETEEDMWFKGYVLDAQDFTPSDRSKTMFVQLIEDKRDTIVWEKKYEIENGFVNGHLFLKNDLPEGTYTLAAYSLHSFTKEAKEFYALKKIKIVKTISQKTDVTPVEKDSILHFSTFAEGGKLVSGIQSRLAFKAVNSKGLPVDTAGALFENNILLQTFKSSHAGMGALTFTPDADKKYHIELSEPKLVSDKKYDIATIESSGKILNLLANAREYLLFKISQSEGSKPEKVFLRLQLRGVVYSIATGMLKKELTIKIPLKEVPQGIAEVTLFNENALPIAERLVFVKQDQKLNIQTKLNKSEFITRDKANLKIKVTDENGQAVVAHLGLSVYDAIYQNKQDAKNIQSHYLLSTQLKGNIYNPAYYFDEKNKDRKEALDLVLLTQGWRNYVWNENNLKEKSLISPVVFDEIKGKVQLVKPDKKAADSTPKAMILFAADENREQELMMTDAAGFFTIGSKNLKIGEGGYTYMKLMTPEKPKYQISIKDNSFEVINNERKNKTIIYPFPEIEKINPKEISPFIGRESINKLKEVVITSKKKGQVFRDKYIGKLDSLYRIQSPTVDFFCPLTNYLNCPRCKDGCHSSDRLKPVEGGVYINTSRYVWIVQCHSYLNDDRNEVVYHYPNLTEAELLAFFNMTMLEGYYGKKVFYEAVYDEVTSMDSTPDYRNTLFWKSDIITDEKGEAVVDFFCSDINSLFIGNLEGVSGTGLLGTENFEFRVRKKQK
ncbi:hypothetical protein AAGV33_13335 [Flavobacterium sp. FBOR7N2.3]|uniref:Macroglobulin domain-containing protein n=1 Tax=Flavobacterium magnesitis TaxID=3138077 RepID=A0ABV4TR55_9FLAO